MRVRAREMGFYRGRRIRPGVEFELIPPDKLGKWMDEVGKNGELVSPKATKKPVFVPKKKPVTLSQIAREGVDP